MIKDYFNRLNEELIKAIALANEARSRGYDPEDEVEIPLAKDLAERVENLLGIEGIADRIRKLDRELSSREEIALRVGLDLAEGRFGRFSSRVEIVEMAIRSATAILTEGVVAAPIEGISQVEEGRNDDGSTYIKVYYAGPIRSAGGTAQALSVLVADYVRRKLGFSVYKPRKEEIERYVAEIHLYRRVANLQYTPSDGEIRMIVENCPVCIDGEPTEDIEVEGYHNLERVATSRVRGGMALVIAEGVALKAPKIKKYVETLGIDGWGWLDELIKNRTTGSADGKNASSKKFLSDIIAGRPVFSHPSRPGGFRIRYGRARNLGLATCGVHPATMIVLEDFLAPGTQMKVELPGKAAGIAPVDTIEGPSVVLKSGELVKINSIEEARRLKPMIERIVDLGEVLINYGDFLENNHPLIPAGYTPEWWELEVMRAGGDPTEIRDLNPETAIRISRELNVPLHPDYTYLWHDISMEELNLLGSAVVRGRLEGETLYLRFDSHLKDILERLLVPHRVEKDLLVIDDARILLATLGIDEVGGEWERVEGERVIDAVSRLSGIRIRERAPSRLGCRMGRPEKSRRREMKPPVHVLFPVGDAGGSTRSLITASSQGVIEVELAVRVCDRCGKETYLSHCACGGRTSRRYVCQACGRIGEEDGRCKRCGGWVKPSRIWSVDIRKLYTEALKRLNERELKLLKGIKALMSRDKIPEPIEKGILRAKHDLSLFKDGTTRYDLTDMPLTHFKPSEVNVDVSRLRDLGYDVSDPEEIVELAVQDIILSKDAGEYLLRVSQFIDDLLVKFYDLPPYYRAKSLDDLIGVLVIGLAPHTSAGVLGRIIGFTSTSVCYAHPFFHAAKRRNCDGDEDCVMLLMDGLINFSRSYLPDRRGGRMDAPLVLTTQINPREIDSEAHNIDICDRYPLEFYEATLSYTNPKDVKPLIETVESRLGGDMECSGFRFTHDVSDISLGPRVSSYKTLETMIDKMKAQLELAKKIRAVDARDVAERIINTHFIRDLRGNLRAFGTQTVRCSKCNSKYRRVPLTGSCTRCGNRLVLTVHEGSVRKYLETSLKIASEFDLASYTRRRLEIIEEEVASIFDGGDKRQMELVDFM
ncbi:MAG TPA: DNA polymerase II large subunit [Candidatus Syntrophoarchaeum butanivorans]|uniref:DNA polymerase II large subunit n=1 Tax=Candidatus Syntropharchaeum butanivorans TaxID=1839936 RepID=A0A1F2P4F2_9EURY|nr:MAG: DNA polymerase II large subunit [Candidatus Syntrophoarchaeum butanivorans]HEC57798.1 DNA polymerase II large subunit [Candidatus Syntrophoarchaeum butanivorans]